MLELPGELCERYFLETKASPIGEFRPFQKHHSKVAPKAPSVDSTGEKIANGIGLTILGIFLGTTGLVVLVIILIVSFNPFLICG